MAGIHSDENLTPKMARFVAEYPVDLNATQAAIRAGYSEKTAHVQGPRLLDNVAVKQALNNRLGPRLEKAGVTAERVLAAIAEIAFGDIRKMFGENGRLMRPDEWDDETAASVAGMDVVTVSAGEGVVEHVAKIKRSDRLRALDMLARHHALYNDKIEVSVTDALAERLERAAREK